MSNRAVLRLNLPPDVSARIAVAMDERDDDLAFALLASAADHQARGDPMTLEQVEAEARETMKRIKARRTGKSTVCNDLGG